MAEEAVNLTNTEEEQTIPEHLPVLPLHQGVLFPELTVPLLVSRPDHIKLIDEALLKDRALVAVAQRDNTVEKPALVDLYRVGVAVFILKMMRSPEGHYHLLVRTYKKVRLTETVQEEPYLVAKVEIIEDAVQMDKQIEAMVLNIRNLFQRVAELANMPAELAFVATNVEGPHPLISLVASNLDLTLAEAQEILETLETQTVLERLTVHLNQRLETLELSQEIQKKIKDGMDKTQRDYMLREQLKAIQKELGEGDERTVEIDELKKKLEETPMPDEVRDVAGKELDRLSRMPPAAAEYTVSRTYLDWLLELPWEVSTEDNLDITAAQETLDADHY
ncbi:MAG: LON peptidase substrate-binding domain-containing protein, partial [Deltaproteobacteria bacterium]|nr:LON peptidase substrate-binding domain-containing protein [Deltaproteobacteria bacterium]